MKEHIQSPVKQEVLSLVANIAFANVPSWYGATRRNLHMDLIVPKLRENHPPCPCIVWICGGAYMVVDHSVWIPEMLRFARAGYVVASIEYRTSNEARFPAPLVDCKSAIRYLRAHAAEYCIDPERIFVMGESAGGTMACLVGATGSCTEFEQGDYLEYSSAVQGVVDFYGGGDLTMESSVNVSDDVPYWTMEAFLGPHYSNELAKKASAVTYLGKDTPPFLILHGTDDPLAPVAQSDRLYEALQACGADATYLLLEGAGHGDPMFYQDAVCEKILAFLNRLVK